MRVFGFGPKDMSLELKHVIMDAHNKGVTAVALNTSGDTIISGGGEGMVRKAIGDRHKVQKNQHIHIISP